VEVVSFSRIAPVTKNPLFYRTVDVSSIGKAYGKRMSDGDAGQQGWFTLSKAGYMVKENGDYFIYPTKELFGTQHFRVHEDIAIAAGIKQDGKRLARMAIKKDEKWRPNKDEYHWMRQSVWFKPVQPTSHLPESPTYYADVTEMRLRTDNNRPDSDWEEGYFIASGWVPSPKGKGKMRHWIVGPIAKDREKIPVSDEDIDLYEALTGGKTQAVKKDDMSVLPEKEGAHIPCFYTFWQDKNKNEHVAFGHTGMFRLPYLKPPAEMLPDALRDIIGSDLAEAMFGFVDQSKSERGAVAGRVFITDAKLEGDPKQAVMKEMVFSDQTLSGPKPTTVQHYLNQDDPDHPENLKHYDSDPNTETSLRGHKFYWHVGASADIDKRLARAPEHRLGDHFNKFKPVKAGQKFVFDIYFENLQPRELGVLLWVLDKASGSYRLKIGMGKPYGLGSIEITYEASLTDRTRRYDDLFQGDGWNLGFKSNIKDVIDNAKAEFRNFVIQDERVNPTGAKDIDELPRVKELLALLNWQSRPSEEKTRYMELKEFTGQKHIFPELTGRPTRRPVLPAATNVIDNHWFAGLPGEEPRSKTNSGGGRQITHQSTPTIAPQPVSRTIATPKVITPPPSKRVRPPKPERPVPVEKETSRLEINDIILGIVEKTTGAGKEASLTLPHGDNKDHAIIPAGTTTIHGYKKDEKVLLQVTKIEGNPQTGYKITCLPVDI
jgi:CRISPR-associated protein (TIGR03986 family)